MVMSGVIHGVETHWMVNGGCINGTVNATNQNRPFMIIIANIKWT